MWKATASSPAGTARQAPRQRERVSPYPYDAPSAHAGSSTGPSIVTLEQRAASACDTPRLSSSGARQLVGARARREQIAIGSLRAAAPRRRGPASTPHRSQCASSMTHMSGAPPLLRVADRSLGSASAYENRSAALPHPTLKCGPQGVPRARARVGRSSIGCTCGRESRRQCLARLHPDRQRPRNLILHAPLRTRASAVVPTPGSPRALALRCGRRALLQDAVELAVSPARPIASIRRQRLLAERAAS